MVSLKRYPDTKPWLRNSNADLGAPHPERSFQQTFLAAAVRLRRKTSKLAAVSPLFLRQREGAIAQLQTPLRSEPLGYRSSENGERPRPLKM